MLAAGSWTTKSQRRKGGLDGPPFLRSSLLLGLLAGPDLSGLAAALCHGPGHAEQGQQSWYQLGDNQQGAETDKQQNQDATGVGLGGVNSKSRNGQQAEAQGSQQGFHCSILLLGDKSICLNVCSLSLGCPLESTELNVWFSRWSPACGPGRIGRAALRSA